MLRVLKLHLNTWFNKMEEKWVVVSRKLAVIRRKS